MLILLLIIFHLVKKITAKAEENVKMNFSWEFLAKEFSDILEKYHYK